MKEDQANISYLWQKFEEKTATKDELDLLFSHLKGSAYDEESLAFLEAQFAAHTRVKTLDREYLATKLNEILKNRPATVQATGSELQGDTFLPASATHSVRFLKNIWLRYAAIFLLVAGTAIWLFRPEKPQEKASVVRETLRQPDFQPGGNRAILTLADGRTIILDSAGNGDIAQQGSTKILKVDAGSISYKTTNKGGELLFNTISTPKGGQYQVTLPDGTKVWLNAASSIRFPTSFGKDRPVEITGESYLEIAPDKSRPFYVKVGEATIQVLGTSFNVNAYDNENSINTTLFEGALRVYAGGGKAGNEVALKPGQQASVSKKTGVPAESQTIAVKTNVKMDNVLAWKNGVFNFNGADLGEVMRQLERWYDIEVQYEKGIPDLEFVGKMRRDLKLPDVLRGLEVSEVHFKMHGRTVTVMP